MSNYFKKANLALVLILLIGLCFPGNVSAAPGSSVAQTPSFGKTSPTSGATVSPTGVKLQWQSITHIFQYRYCYYSYEITTNVCNIDNKSTWITNGTTTSVTLPTLAGNKTYYWQIGAKLEDNTWVYANGSSGSKWSFTTTAGGTTPTPTDRFIYDDADSKWTYTGNWVPWGGSGPYNNTDHYTSTNGDTADITIVGTKFTLTYVRGANRGTMNVFVDGILRGSINASSSTLQWKQTWNSPTFPAGTHNVQIVHTGGPDTFIDVDSIEVFGVVQAGTYDDNSINWVYTGTWLTFSGTGPYNNTLHYTSTTGSGAEFSFDGVQFTFTYLKSNNRGDIEVTVDGTVEATIHAYNTSTLWKQTWTSPVYPAGVHTVRFEFVGAGSYIDVDAIKISGSSGSGTVWPGIYDDTHSAWSYAGTWTSNTVTGAYNNTLHYTGTAGDTATLTFRGTKFNLYYTRATNRGTLDVTVDALPPVSINAHNTSTLYKQVWTSPTYAQGDHTVTITHSGIGSYIDVDAIEVFGMVPAGSYDDTNNNWTYSGVWTASTVSGAYSSTLHKTSTVGSTAEITFEGARFILTYTKGNDRGDIRVYVDGFEVGTIHANNSSTAWQQTWDSGVLAGGPDHTVAFEHAGSGTYIDIDKIQIFQDPPVAFPGTYDDASTAWIYSPNEWSTFSGTGPYNNTSHYTGIPGAVAEISFTGTQFTLTYLKASNRGLIDVWVDGFYEDTIDAHGTSTQWKQTWTSKVYPLAVHTIDFVHGGPVNTYIDIDLIQLDSPFDPIPPAAITDLAAVSGTNPGTVSLSWTAPSDNNANGAAVAAYQVRYSTSAITTQLEWDAATPVTTGLPSPRSAGHTEAMTVTGLVPGDTYHFAVRAEDEDGSLADLSNDDSTTAANLTALAAGTYDDPNVNIVYLGTWITYSGSGPYLNTLHYSSTAGSEARFAFNGSKFILTYVKASDRGNIDVTVDGLPAGTIIAHNTGTVWRATWTSPIFAVGIHDVVLTHAGGGTYIDIDAIQVYTPADVMAPAQIINLGALPGTVGGSVALTWTAPGDDGGIGTAASYLVRYSTTGDILNEANWNTATAVTSGIPTPLPAGQTQNMTVTGLTPGTNYHFAVRAQDEEPNIGLISNAATAAASDASTLAPGKYDDNNTSLLYLGTWSTYTGTGPSGNTLHFTSTVGDEARFRFNGVKFNLTYVKSNQRGQIQVLVDGVPDANGPIVATNPSTVWKATWTSDTYPAGIHTVQLVHAGGGTYIDVDAVEIFGPPPTLTAGNYDDTHAGWTYLGSWITYSGTGPVSNTLHYSADVITPGSASVTINGSAFILTYVKSDQRGDIDVYVDGLLFDTIHANNPATVWRATWNSGALPGGPGVHTVEFRHAGGGTYIDIDAIQVLP